MDLKTCPICEARWINGKHFWATGRPGNELDLAGLVCNKLRNGREGCINPLVGCEGGDTWEKRFADLNSLDSELGVHPSLDIDISYQHPYKEINIDDLH